MNDTKTEKTGGQVAEFTATGERLSEKLAVMKLTGEVDLYTSPRVRSAMLEYLDAGCSSLIVDLSEVDYLDSSGLGTLVASLKRTKEHGGQVYLVSPRPRIARVLDVTGLNEVFSILGSVEEARAAAERS